MAKGAPPPRAKRRYRAEADGSASSAWFLRGAVGLLAVAAAALLATTVLVGRGGVPDAAVDATASALDARAPEGAGASRELPLLLGTGFGRTGTSSLAQALVDTKWAQGWDIYNMRTVFMRNMSYHVERWMHIHREHARGRPVAHLFRELFAGYRAVTDYPAMAWWREIREALPEVRVLHTARPADDWYRSSSETTFAIVDYTQTGRLERLLEIEEAIVGKSRKHWERAGAFNPVFRDYGEMMQKVVWDRVFGEGVNPADPEMRERVIAGFDRHDAAVREALAGDPGFLAWGVADGWPPLCRHLGLASCPGGAFPRMNDRATFYRSSLLPTLNKRLKAPARPPGARKAGGGKSGEL